MVATLWPFPVQHCRVSRPVGARRVLPSTVAELRIMCSPARRILQGSERAVAFCKYQAFPVAVVLRTGRKLNGNGAFSAKSFVHLPDICVSKKRDNLVSIFRVSGGKAWLLQVLSNPVSTSKKTHITFQPVEITKIIRCVCTQYVRGEFGVTDPLELKKASKKRADLN